MTEIGLIIFSYLLGSIPTGVIVSKVLDREDPRQKGSGNIGATNVLRTSGKKAGALTLAGDVAKGFIPTFTAIQFFESPLLISIAAFSAFLGHLYPVFLKFKGGKGVAVAGGVFLPISPLSMLLAVLIFIVIVYIWRYVSLGSL